MDNFKAITLRILLLVVLAAASSAQTDEATAGVRLSEGFAPTIGSLEVLLEGDIWAPVCRSQYDSLLPWVVCQQLELGDSGFFYPLDFFGPGEGQFYVHGITCTGHEANVQECEVGDANSTACTPGETIAIACSGRVSDESGGTVSLNEGVVDDMHLAGGTTNECGLLEVLVNGTWGGVCSKGFGDLASEVACRQLGLQYDPEASYYTSYSASDFGVSEGPIWMDQVSCSGNETFLDECGFLGWNVTACPEQVGLTCYNATELAAFPDRLNCSVDWWRGESLEDVGLVNGTSTANGRLQVMVNGTWGAACNVGSQEVATVVCRELGLPPSGAVYNDTRTFTQAPPAWIQNVTCSGAESSLGGCSVERANPEESWYYGCADQLISCTDNPESGNPLLPPQIDEIRLANGTNEGYLEVKAHGMWAGVQAGGMTPEAGVVACRQLGYPGVVTPPDRGDYNFLGYTEPDMMYTWSVNCTGEEPGLAECPFHEREPELGYSGDAYIMCTPHGGWYLEDTRLVNMSGEAIVRSEGGASAGNVTEGRLEVWGEGNGRGTRWGAISNLTFGENEAIVACRTLLFPDTTSAQVYVPSDPDYADWFTMYPGVMMWIKEIKCTGSESKLRECDITWCDETCPIGGAVGVKCA